MGALVLLAIKTLAPFSLLPPLGEEPPGLANNGPLHGSADAVGDSSTVSAKVDVGKGVSLGAGVLVNVDVGGMADIIPTIIVLTSAVSEACI